MVFKKLAMEFAQYGEDDIEDLQNELKNACGRSLGPFGDVKMDTTIQENRQTTGPTKKRKKLGAREQSDVLKDLILALDLCHNVTPVYPNEDDPTEKDY